MQHFHYDLDKIERDIRRMYATVPAKQIEDDPDTAECRRRSVDIEVAMAKWWLNEVMRGTPADILFNAFVSTMANNIMNRLDGLVEIPGQPEMAGIFMHELVQAVGNLHAQKVERDGPTSHAIPINSVTSGHA